MTTFAEIAVSLAVGTWWGIHWAEVKHRIETALADDPATIQAEEPKV